MVQSERNSLSIVLKVIWGALFFSQFSYAYILYYQTSGGVLGVAVESNFPMTIIFCAAALVSLVASVFLPRLILNAGKKKIQEKFRTNNLQKIEVNDLFPFFIAPLFIRLALLETVAIYGFTLGFLNQDMEYFYPFLCVSTIGFLRNFPSEEKVKSSFS